MIVLVRCHDNTYAPALESHLEELVSKAQIAAFLNKGMWIEVSRRPEEECDLVPAKRMPTRLSGMVACF